LVKIFYGASSSILLSDRPVTIGSDVYNPWLKTVPAIRYSLPLLPGLGRLADCELEIGRNSTTDNLLTGTVAGKKVQIWQWFEGLADADKLPLANLVSQEIVDVTQSTFTLRCISPETKLKQRIPTKDLNKTDFPNMPDSNLGIPRPIVFGNFKYEKLDGSKYHGSDTALSPQEEYIWCKKPHRVGVPAFWIDMKASPGTPDKKKLIVHESADALAILTDISTELGGQELLKYYSEPQLYGFSRNENATSWPGKCWTAVNVSARSQVERNVYQTGDTTTGGQFMTLYKLGDRSGSANTVTDYQDALDLDPATTAALSGSLILEVEFDGSGTILGEGKKRYICFTVGTLAAGVTIEVWDSNGGAYTSRGTISGPFTGPLYKEFLTTYWTDNETFFLMRNYKVKLTITGGSGTIDGLAAKLIFVDMDDTTLLRWTKWTMEHWANNQPKYKEVTRQGNYSNVFFYLTKGLDVNIDSKSYDYRHPVFPIQYILRSILGYTSAEMGYASIGASYLYLTNSAPFSNTWLRFANAINDFRTGEEIIGDLAVQMGCWLWWGAEGFWQLIPCNYSNMLTTSIRIFSDSKADVTLSGSIINPMSNFKWQRIDRIYNRFEFNVDFEFATGKYRNRIVYDQINKTELATSVSDYGHESIYPLQDYSWYRDSLQVDNFYQIVKHFKDPGIEIEFDTTLCASHLEVGDNLKVDHIAQTWAVPTSTTGKEFQILEHEQTGNVIHLKAIEIVP
jgi:hypothetical protein